jgi:hypothetical protein
MTDNIIDLTKARNEREAPDPEFVHKDEFGRSLYVYSLSYQHGDSEFSFHIPAYNIEDAQAHVASMNANGIRLDGQVFGMVPA